MAVLVHFCKTDNTLRSQDSTAAEETNYTISWSDLTTAGFEAGDNAIIIVACKIWCNNAEWTNRFKVGFGTTYAGRTDDTTSQTYIESPSADVAGSQYFWVKQRTLVNNENVYFTKQGQSTYLGRYQEFVCLVINYDDIDAADKLWATATHSGDAPTTYTTGANAATGAAGDWLIFASSRWLVDGTSENMYLAINDGTSDVAEVFTQSEDTYEERVFGTIAYRSGLGASVTVAARYKEVGATAPPDCVMTSIFGIRLDQFASYWGVHTTNTITHSVVDTYQEAATNNAYVLGETGPFVVLGWPIHATNEATKNPYGRIQFDGSDWPAANANRIAVADEGASSRLTPFLFGYAASQAAATYDIDIDVAEDVDVSPTYNCVEQVCAAWTFALLEVDTTLEALYPDSIATSTNLTGAVTSIDEDPDNPDANWLTADSATAVTDLRVTFPTPSGDPYGSQNFRLQVRKTTGSSNPTVDVSLYQGGSSVATLLNDTSITSDSSQVIQANWTASQLSGTTDGSDVECRIVSTVGQLAGTITRTATPTSFSTSTAAVTDWSFAHNAAANTTLILLTVLAEAHCSVQGTPTWDSGGTPQDFTLIRATTSSGTDGDMRAYIYGVIPGVTGNRTIGLTVTGTAIDCGFACAVSYLGTVTSSVANAAIYLDEEINSNNASTVVAMNEAAAGVTGRTAFAVADFRGGDGDPAAETVATGFSELFDSATGAGTADDISYWVGDKINWTPSGVTVDWTGSISDECVGILIELVPASGVATNTVEIGAIEWNAQYLTPAGEILTADAGTIVLAGQSAALKYQRLPLTASSNTVVVTGQSATLKYQKPPLTASSNTIVVAGQPANLKYQRNVFTASSNSIGVAGQIVNLKYQRLSFTATSNTITLAGQSATLKKQTLPLTASSGSVIVTGGVAALKYQRLPLTISSNVVVLSGQSATLKYQRLPFAALANTVIITGQSAALKYQKLPLTASASSIVINGQAASLKYQRLSLTATAGSIVSIGQVASLKYHRLAFTASSGTVIIDGSDATLSYASVGHYVLIASYGAVNATGQSASIKYQRNAVTVSSGSIALAGQSANLEFQRNPLSATSNTIIISGIDASLKYQRSTLTLELNSIVVNGQNALLKYQRNALIGQPNLITFNGGTSLLKYQRLPFDASSNTILINGMDADLSVREAGRFINAESGIIILTGQSVNFATGAGISDSVILTGLSDAVATASEENEIIIFPDSAAQNDIITSDYISSDILLIADAAFLPPDVIGPASRGIAFATKDVNNLDIDAGIVNYPQKDKTITIGKIG
jgi:hypothetical protein